MSDQLQIITTAILEIKNDIERIAEKQDEMVRDMRDVKTAIYNPDSGLYARLRSLEQWRDATSRTTWFLATAVGGLVLKTVWDLLLA